MHRSPTSRANRRHARRRTAAVAAIACGAVIAAAGPAGASVTVGQLAPVPPAPTCSANFDYLQPSVTGGNLYVAREAGTITSWTTNSSGAGASYGLKIFRRTSDPDAFQAIAHAQSQTLSAGLNTFAVSIPVRSGDMLGLHEGGPVNSCTFSTPGDSVLNRAGDLSDGASDAFSPQNDVRLNLSAILVPSNDFMLGIVTRDRRRGSAGVTAFVSNPGLVTLSGKGLKKSHAAKTVAVAGPVPFQFASTGARKRRLERTGAVKVTVTVTFYPTGGDPASKVITVKLIKRRPLQFG